MTSIEFEPYTRYLKLGECSFKRTTIIQPLWRARIELSNLTNNQITRLKEFLVKEGYL